MTTRSVMTCARTTGLNTAGAIAASMPVATRLRRGSAARMTMLMLIAGGTLVSCADGGADDPCGGIVQPLPRAITTSPAALVLDIGADSVIVANSSGGCSNDDRTVVWITSNPQVATVDANGRVRAVGGGSAILTASVFSNQARVTLPVTVRARLASRILARPARQYPRAEP